MGRTVRLTDQMLSDDIDTLAIVETGSAPAWTEVTGDRITINAGMMPRLTSRTNVAVWLGTNRATNCLFHSILYPARPRTQLVRRVQSCP